MTNCRIIIIGMGVRYGTAYQKRVDPGNNIYKIFVNPVKYTRWTGGKVFSFEI